jgi:hypothetical protein
MVTKKRATKKSTTRKPAAKKRASAKPASKTAAKRRAADAAKVRKTDAGRTGAQAATKRRAADPAEAIREFAEREAPGRAAEYETFLCLACIFDLFTKQLGIAPRTAFSEVKRYAPAVEELTARTPAARPYFDSADKHPHCPYCGSAKRWHARLTTYRIEGGKATDAARRALVKKLPKSEEQFVVVERKTTARAVFFEWLDDLGRGLDFENDEAWMLAATRAYLERREPKTDWAETFEGLRAVRRSQRLDAGWERDGVRLFLAPALYNDVLLVQYLVSRSHRHGGRTFEGRLTLIELVRRMRHSGHLEAQGISERDQFEVLERLVEQLTGGDQPVKLHYIVDRRDLLAKVKDVYARYAT